MRNNVFYKESQGFGTWWLYILLIGLLGKESYDFYQNYLENEELSFGVSFWIILVVSIAMLSMRLYTSIDYSGLEISFIPFTMKKRWNWKDIERAYLREYDITDFGGWGYRISSQGIAYNTKGKHGIQLVLKNGKKIMIGTQNKEEVDRILKKLGVTDEK